MIVDASRVDELGNRRIVDPERAQIHIWGLEIWGGECLNKWDWWMYRENGRAHEHWIEGDTCARKVAGPEIWIRKRAFTVHYFARLRSRMSDRIVPGLGMEKYTFGNLTWAWSNGRKAVLQFDGAPISDEYNWSAHMPREIRITGNAIEVVKWWQ